MWCLILSIFKYTEFLRIPQAQHLCWVPKVFAIHHVIFKRQVTEIKLLICISFLQKQGKMQQLDSNCLEA